MFLGDSGDSGAGGFGVGLDGEGADEAEVDDVAGEFGVVAVAEGGEDVGFGEHCWIVSVVSVCVRPGMRRGILGVWRLRRRGLGLRRRRL